MISRTKKEDVLSLKNQVLDSGMSDKEGRTLLDIRADKNRGLPNDSETKLYEEDLVIELLNSVTEFDGPHIARIINYVTHSGFSNQKIADVSLNQIKNGRLNFYQGTELIKYVLSIDSNKIDIDLVRQGLSEVKQIKPWLYTELLSLKSPYMALEYAVYLLLSNQYNSSSFIKLFLKWFEANDLAFYKAIASKLYPILKDPNAIKIVKFKFDEKGISNLLMKEESQVLQNPPKSIPQSYVLTGSPAFQELKKDLIVELKRNYQPEYAI